MRVISVNVNGIRAAERKGFFTWLKAQQADVVCIQETKAQVHQLEDPVFHPKGYHCYYFDAEKKGYSGVAIYTRVKPDKIVTGLGWSRCDQEGRYLQIDYQGLSLASFYLPSGSASEDRQQSKLDFMDQLITVLKKMRRKRRDFILCGDWNTVHKEIDIKNFKSNQKNSGCTPVERAWLDQLFDEVGYVDAFRVVEQRAEQYTWWSNRGRARENNVGWRLDYHIVTPGIADTVQQASVYKDAWFSDHAPLIIDYDLTLCNNERF